MLGAKAATQYAATVEQGAGQGRVREQQLADQNCSRGRWGGAGQLVLGPSSNYATPMLNLPAPHITCDKHES